MGLYIKILIGTILCGSIITGISKVFENIREEVYRGEIDGYSVVYEEGKFSVGKSSNFLENRMTLKKGDTSYFFEDTVDESNIN